MSERPADALILQALSGLKDDMGRLRDEQRDERRDAAKSRQRLIDEISTNRDMLARQAQDISDLRHEVHQVDERVADIETEMPAFREFGQYKLKAEGAGIFGKLAWRTGYYVIAGAAALYAFREQIVAFFRGVIK